MPQRRKHTELERLRQARADAGVEHRKAVVELELLTNREAMVEEEIRVAYSQGRDPTEPAQELSRLRSELIPNARLRQEGMARKVQETDQARMAFGRDNMDELQRELDPREEKALERRDEAQQELRAAEAELADLRAAREALLRDDPDLWVARQHEPLPTVERAWA
jgi:hypothetical protein